MRLQNFFDFITLAFVALLGAFYIWISAKIGGGDKETIEYRFESRLHSAQRVQDKFFRLAVARRSGKAERILGAATDVKRVRDGFTSKEEEL